MGMRVDFYESILEKYVWWIRFLVGYEEYVKHLNSSKWSDYINVYAESVLRQLGNGQWAYVLILSWPALSRMLNLLILET